MILDIILDIISHQSSMAIVVNTGFKIIEAIDKKYENKKYITLRSPVKDLRVIPHNELEGDYTNALSPDEVRVLSKDIRFIQMGESKIYDSNYDPVQDHKNWFLYYIAGLLILFFIAKSLYLSPFL